MKTSSPSATSSVTRWWGNPGRGIGAILCSLAAAAIVGPSVIVLLQPVGPTLPSLVTRDMPIAPKAAIPAVDPVKLASIAPADARMFNARIPFSTGPNPAARPFRLAAQGPDAARAIDCLATAVLFEAGDDAVGESAVAQVVINRVRHPAFPKSICGVVFQGSERRTGCQFTFTCDGALRNHRWSDAAWLRAKDVARLALAGRVYAPVGYATHYHTDWVVPYWSSSLDKVNAVGTHLFFRWTGWWGTPGAFNRVVSSVEPAIAQLTGLSLAHSAGLDPNALALNALPAEDYVAPKPVAGDGNSFLATIDRRAPPDSFRQLAEASCGARSFCKYMAWTAKFRTPSALPLDSFQIATMSFSYLRDRDIGFEKALWNCQQFVRADLRQCMKLQTFQQSAAAQSGTDAPAVGAGPNPTADATLKESTPMPAASPPATKAKGAGAAKPPRPDAPATAPTPAP